MRKLVFATNGLGRLAKRRSPSTPPSLILRCQRGARASKGAPSAIPRTSPPPASSPRRTSRPSKTVAARYAVAITPAMAELIDPGDRPIRSRASSFRTQPSSNGAGGNRRPDRRRGAQPGARHRPPLSRPRAAEAGPGLRRLLPVLLSPRDGGPGRPGTLPRRARRRRLAYIAADPEIWEVIVTGGDPLVASPRRLAALMARAGGHRPRQGRALPHPRAGRRTGADHARISSRR